MSHWISHCEDKPITSIGDAIQIARHCCDRAIWPLESGTELGPSYKLPFGLWYRGHASSQWKLEPSVFRHDDKLGYFDETSVYYHFQLRSPSFRNEHQPGFTALALLLTLPGSGQTTRG